MSPFCRKICTKSSKQAVKYARRHGSSQTSFRAMEFACISVYTKYILVSTSIDNMSKRSHFVRLYAEVMDTVMERKSTKGSGPWLKLSAVLSLASRCHVP